VYHGRSLPDARDFFGIEIGICIVAFHGEKQRKDGMRTGRAGRDQMGFGVDEREREYVSFMLVAATVLALLPSSIKVIISS